MRAHGESHLIVSIQLLSGSVVENCFGNSLVFPVHVVSQCTLVWCKRPDVLQVSILLLQLRNYSSPGHHEIMREVPGANKRGCPRPCGWINKATPSAGTTQRNNLPRVRKFNVDAPREIPHAVELSNGHLSQNILEPSRGPSQAGSEVWFPADYT